MATTESLTHADRRNRIAIGVLAGLLVFGIALAVIAYRSPAPQMGADEEVFNTVDALYTAVRNRDEKRLSECETRLKSYRDAGKLPLEAAEKLDSIIAKARGGSWDTAAERLYDFMLAQKREQNTEESHAKPQRRKEDKGRK